MTDIDIYEKRIAYLYTTIACLIGICFIHFAIYQRMIQKVEKEKNEIQQELKQCNWELGEVPNGNQKAEE